MHTLVDHFGQFFNTESFQVLAEMSPTLNQPTNQPTPPNQNTLGRETEEEPVKYVKATIPSSSSAGSFPTHWTVVFPPIKF